MPSSNRFSHLHGPMRNHPLIVAGAAASVGVLLGGFVAVQLLGTPPGADSALPGAPQTTAEIKAAPKPAAETTGSAVAGDNVASAECEQQTWPHLSPGCLEEYRSTHRPARVVSTDRLDKRTIDAIESSPLPPAATSDRAQSEFVASLPWAPAVTSISPLAPAPAATSPAPAATAPIGAAPVSPPAVAAATGQTPPSPASQPAAKSEAKEKHAAKKARRKPKTERKAPSKPEFDDADDAVVTARSNESDDGPTAAGRGDRPRRTSERWTERDYDVPDQERHGHRRVMVLERGGGGLFGNLFVGFGD